MMGILSRMESGVGVFWEIENPECLVSSPSCFLPQFFPRDSGHTRCPLLFSSSRGRGRVPPGRRSAVITFEFNGFCVGKMGAEMGNCGVIDGLMVPEPLPVLCCFPTPERGVAVGAACPLLPGSLGPSSFFEWSLVGLLPILEIREAVQPSRRKMDLGVIFIPILDASPRTKTKVPCLSSAFAPAAAATSREGKQPRSKSDGPGQMQRQKLGEGGRGWAWWCEQRGLGNACGRLLARSPRFSLRPRAACAVATAMADAVSVAETGLVLGRAAPPRMPCNLW